MQENNIMRFDTIKKTLRLRVALPPNKKHTKKSNEAISDTHTTYETLDLVARAKRFAESAHRSINHKRKYTNEDYCVHLEEVVKLLKTVSHTPEMIAAAWLHDTIEDTQTTLDEIHELFGNTVAEYVLALTDISRPEDGNRHVRKEIDRQHLVGSKHEVQTIKLADLISNSKQILEFDPKFAKIYLEEKRLLLEILNTGNPVLYAQALEIVQENSQKTSKTVSRTSRCKA